MKILILGDVMGISGREAIKKNLPKIINDNKIDFTIINGENAADNGRGITQLIAEEFFYRELMLLLLEIIFGNTKRHQLLLQKKKDY